MTNKWISIALKVIVAVCAVAVPAFGQTGAISGFCSLGAAKAMTSGLPSSNYAQGLIPQCTVTVYQTGTTNLATIYSDTLSTPLTNPFTATTAGEWLFFAAANQGYDVVLSGGVSPNTYPSPKTLVGLYPSTNVIAASTPAGPAFAVNFANSLVNAFQGDSNITVNPTTHTFTAPNVVLTGLGPTTLPVCPNGSGGALTTSGCTSGTAANPAGPAFAVNFANSAVTSFQGDSTITINPTTHAFAAPINSGSKYATLYQTGGGNNGILNCAALGTGVCVADPTYGITEQYSFTHMIPSVPSQFQFQDQRQGMTQAFYHNFPYARNATFTATPSGQSVSCLLDAPFTLGYNALYECSQDYFYDSAPGFSVGNVAVPLLGSANWQVGTGRNTTYYSLGAGIREALNTVMQHNGNGDTAWYAYINSHGGARATSDEGTEFAEATLEDTTQFRETCTTGCTTGSQSIAGTVTNAGSQGARCCIIDVTQGPIINTYTLSAVANASGGTTAYTGTGLPSSCTNSQSFAVSGFLTSANNGTFTCNSSNSTTLTLNNTSGVAETDPGTAKTTFSNLITNLAAGLNSGMEAVTFATPVTVSNFWGTLGTTVTGNTSIGSPIISSLSTTTGFAVGMSVVGTGIQASSYIVTIGSGSVTLNANATANGTGVALVVGGNVQPNSTDVSHSPYGTVLSFFVNSTTGVPVVTTPMCFASQFHDVISPTTVTGSGPYTITALVRKPHASGSVIMQGGLCGTGMEIIANTPNVSNPNRYLVDLLGCVSTSVCEATFFRLGAGSPAPFVAGGGNFNSTIYLSGAVTGLTSNGTTVYATGAGGFPTNYNKSNVIFSGASDNALNGSICTAVTFVYNSVNNFTCTLAGLTGQHTATTATFVLATTTAPWSAVNIWPMAEVIDVQDYNSTTCTALNLAPVCVDGTLALEPNIIAFTNGDTIAQLNDEAGEYTGIKTNMSVQNPWSLFHPLFLGANGLAAQGGASGLTGNAYITIGAGGGDSIYTDNGGSVTPLNVQNLFGAFYDYVITQEGPANGRSLFSIATTANQTNNPNYAYNLLSNTNLSGSSTIKVLPYLGDVNITASGQLGLGGTGGNVHFNSNSDAITFNDRIAFAPAPAPTCTVTQGPGAGTLADGTYGYRIAVRNLAGGPGIPGTECTGAVANGGNNSVKVTWTRTGGVGVGYYIYGRTPSGELQMTTAAANTLVFVDNGSITPSGAIPATDLTRGFVDQAAKLCANSSGTAFEGCIAAPASYASTQTFTLPAATGTLATTSQLPLSGTTGTITGTSLTATCDSGTATVSGAVVGSPVAVSSTTGADVGGAFYLRASVTSTNTVTVYICGTGTPASLAYNVRVLP